VTKGTGKKWGALGARCARVFRVQSLGFRISGLGFRLWGLGFKV
jgi:hypothetical protein